MESQPKITHPIRSTLCSILAAAMVCLYPCLFQWFQNAGEAPPDDMLRVLGVFLCTGAVIYLGSLLLLRRSGAAGFFTAAAMGVFCNIGLLTALCKGHFPWMRDRYLLVLGVILLLALLLLLRRLRRFPGTELCLLLVITLSALTLIAFVPAAPTFYEILTAKTNPSAVSGDTEFPAQERPNVYLFLMDEYGGPENLEKYYGFQNQEFLGGLEARGFQFSRSSHNSESIFTWTLVPNLLNLDYVVEDSIPHLVKENCVNDPVLFQVFRRNGYQVNLIDHRDFLGHSGCNVLSRPQISDSIGDYLYDNSALNLIPRFRGWFKEYLGLSTDEYYATELLEIAELTERCADYVTGPTLTVAYLQSPHVPFVLDAQGRPRYTGMYEYVDHQYYLDQLTWTNGVLTRTVDNILRQDPDSIVMLQSDHGNRYAAHVSGVDGNPELDQARENRDMQNILNCVYFRGKPLDIEGLYGINTLRTILNQGFGTDLPMREEPTGYIATTTDWR